MLATGTCAPDGSIILIQAPETKYSVAKDGRIYGVRKVLKVILSCNVLRPLESVVDLKIGTVTTRPQVWTSSRVELKQSVAEAFVPNPNAYQYIKSIDGNRHNTSAANLMWVSTLGETYTEEEAEVYVHGCAHLRTSLEIDSEKAFSKKYNNPTKKRVTKNGKPPVTKRGAFGRILNTRKPTTDAYGRPLDVN